MWIFFWKATRSHGEQAVVLIQRWLQTNMPPQPVAIPVAF
jgi:hypothetical protein